MDAKGAEKLAAVGGRHLSPREFGSLADAFRDNELNLMKDRLDALEKVMDFFLHDAAAPPSGGAGGTRDMRSGDSDARVDDFVNAMLADSANNSAWVPDAIERRVYHKILSMTLRALKGVLDSATVDVAGHTLSFRLEPGPGVPLVKPPTTTTEKSTSFDTIIGDALASLFASARVQVVGHEVLFCFQ